MWPGRERGRVLLGTVGVTDPSEGVRYGSVAVGS